MPSDAPSHVGPYQILSVLGSGGMGTVYKGFQPSLNRIVAIKILPPQFVRDPERVERFHREAQAVALLSHPDIVQIIDKGREGDLMYFVMEYIDGGSLDAVLEKRRLTVAETLHVVKEIGKGLQCAHANGIVHRDLKPRNVMVSADLSVVKLTDFGISRIESISAAAGTLTTANSNLGTLFYFAPEQAEDPAGVDHRADIYSLGVICYELLTGKVPVGKFHLPSELNADLSSELDAVVLKCLAYDKTQRYFSVQDFLADIEALEKTAGLKLLDELRGLSKSTSRLFHRSTTGAGKNRSALFAAAAVLLVALAGGTILFVKGRPRSSGSGPDVSAVSKRAGGASGSGEALSTASDPLAAIASRPATVPFPPAAAPAPSGSAAASQLDATTPATSPSAASAAPPSGGLSKGIASLTSAPPGASTAPASKSRAPAARAAAVDPAVRDLETTRAAVTAKQYDQALSDLHSFLLRYPGHPLTWDAQNLVASVQEKQGRFADAMSTYRQIANRFPGEPRSAGSLYRLAQLTLQTAGKEQDGRTILGEIAERYPGGQWFVPSLKAKSALEERLKLKERDPVLLAMVPSSLMSFRTLVERAPTDPAAEAAFWRLGEMYEDLKRYDLAAQTFANLGSNFPNTSYDAWFRAGELYEKRINDKAAARRAYAQVPQQSPNYRKAQKRSTRLLQ